MKYACQAWDWPLQPKDGLVMVVNDNQRFEADLEMPTFKADEIDVQIINNGIFVRCRNDNDAARLKRHIERAYRLPQDVDMKSVKSSMKSNGTLQITASKRRN